MSIALGATLAACGNLTGNNKKSATTEDGKPIIKMYQIGDKPDNLDVLLKNANKIIEKKVGANWISNILVGVTMHKK